jgi:NADH-quinone oxidoreductase subunit E
MLSKSASPVDTPERFPEQVIPAEELRFTSEELAAIEEFKSRYPKADAAVMRVLWLAQEKFGYLPPEVIKLVADTLEMPYAQAYGVASFYTQFFKEPIGKYVLDLCTCFACQVVGGYDALHHLEEKLGVKVGRTTGDKMFTLRQAECLGACGSGPVVQVSNRSYVHNLTPEKADRLIQDLQQDKMPPWVSMTLPQDEDDETLNGNRRSDAEAVEVYKTSPVATRLD